MRKCLSTLLCLLSLILSQTVQAAPAMKLEIIPLQHRLVSDIVPILQPLLVEGGSLSGMNNQLIIKTTPQNLRELIKTLTIIDRPLRSLKISVRYDTQGQHQGREHGIDGYYDTRNIHIETNKSSSQDQASVTVRGKDRAISYHNWRTESQNSDDDVYFVRTIEGQAAWIRAGKTVPIPERTIVLHPYGSDVYDSVQYRDISSGFYVISNLNGDRVTLTISPQRSQTNDAYAGRVETQEAQMTITGKLGQWISLSGISEQYDEQHHEGTYQTHRYGSEDNHILVKVDEIH